MKGLQSIFLAAGVSLIAGCGVGGSAGPTPVSQPPNDLGLYQIASADAGVPGGLALNKLTVAFTAVGQQAYFYAVERNYTGGFSFNLDCTGSTQSVALGQPSQPLNLSTYFFLLQAVSPGACTVTISDANGRTATVAAGVTITQGNIQ